MILEIAISREKQSYAPSLPLTSFASVAQKMSPARKISFKYIERGFRIDESRVLLKSITFDISRYGKFSVTLMFSKPKPACQVIRMVEAYLSQPVTEEDFEDIGRDTFHEQWMPTLYRIRGDFLGDAKFLEILRVSEDGHGAILTGS